ncbi:MAG: hypothetical protein JNL24_11715 [Bacteroidia bacterium]|nr:hypothetical protein [Bacteroidia bacterium]
MITKTELFEVEYPSDWILKEMSGMTLIYNEKKGNGVVQITTYNLQLQHQTELNDLFLDYLKDQFPMYTVNMMLKSIDKNTINAKFSDEKRFWNIFLKRTKKIVLFVTYNCLIENISDLEIEMTDEIVDSLK